MTPRPQRQTRTTLRLALYALVLVMLVVAFLYAYELLGGPVDALIEAIGDIIGSFRKLRHIDTEIVLKRE